MKLNFTRQEIAQRMLKRAIRLWDIEDIDHLDPIVKLLVEAMAEEFIGLNKELDGIDNRVRTQVSESLTPPQHLTARPSHALIRAFPIETSFLIDREAVFSYTDTSFLQEKGLKPIHLTPTAPFKLFNAHIKYLNICGQMYSYNDNFRRSTVASPTVKSPLVNNVVWIGIEAHDELTSLDRLSLYFDFLHVENKWEYLKLLSCSSWSTDSQALKVLYGIQADPDDKPEEPNYTNSFIRIDIRSRYDIHYVTIDSHSATKVNLPKELETIYKEETLAKFDKPLFWLKIKFPPAASKEILENIKVGMNILPLVDMAKRSFSALMNRTNMSLPLKTEYKEFFIELLSVSDSSGRRYKQEFSDEEPKGEVGYYNLRKAGIERHSNLDLDSTIEHLLSMAHDNKLLGNEDLDPKFVEKLLAMRGLAVAYTTTMRASKHEPQYLFYLTIDKSNRDHHLFADALTTSGAALNQIKITQSLESKLKASIVEGQIMQVTPFRAGANEPSTERSQNRFCYILNSRDSICTKFDLQTFCQAEYGDDIESIEIETGHRIGKMPKQGMQKTICLHIKLRADSSLRADIEEFKTDLFCKLENRSPRDFNYQLLIS